MRDDAPAAVGARLRFLEDADRIGRRLVDDAAWSGERCTWRVHVPDRNAGPGVQRAVEVPAGPFLYQGSAGIALFLGELHRFTGDAGTRRAAIGALRHALEEAREVLPGSIGFHTGRVGVAYACARVGVCVEDAALVEAASALVEESVGREEEDSALDLIGGGAGALIALLNLAGGVLADQRNRLVDAAERMGDRLIATAAVECVGWSWPTLNSVGGTGQARNLTGYAHGASGFAHALLELFRVTGRLKYRYAARQALRYERRWFDAERGNWPDFRHKELLECLRSEGVAAVRERLNGGRAFEPFRPTFMVAWCHGAPGIGLARLRALQILGDGELRREAEAALATTRDSFGQPGRSHCLCHGSFGNAEALLFMERGLGNVAARTSVETFVDEACAERERAGRRWRSGTAAALPDPSLLLGDAGIGHVLLRLHDPSIPPVLCLTSEGLPAAEPNGEDEAGRLAEASVDRFFGASRRAFVRLGALPAADGRASAYDWSPADELRELEEIVAREADSVRRAALDDVLRPERARYERAMDGYNPLALYLELLVRGDPEEVDWTACSYRLSPHASVVSGLGNVVDLEGRGGGAERVESERYIVFDTLEGVEVRRLGGFAAAVLTAAERPTSVDATCARLAKRLSHPESAELLRSRVVEQLSEAYCGGIIEIVRSEGSGATHDP